MLCSKMMLFFMKILVLCVLVVCGDPIQYRKHEVAKTHVSEDNELKDPGANSRDFTYKGVSYKLMMQRSKYVNAKKACENQGSYLVTVYSKDLNDEIVEQLRTAGSIGSVWIGYKDQGDYEDEYKDIKFEWQNPYGSCNRYFNWGVGEPGDQKYLQQYRYRYKECVKLNTNGGKWSTDKCDQYQSFICEKVTDASQVGCKEVIEYKGAKYKFVFKGLQFAYAEKNCQQQDGHLVTIYEEGLQDAITQQVTQNVYPNSETVWIGYHGYQGKWDWRNPSASCFKYTNWGKTTPNPNKGVWWNCITISGNPEKHGVWDGGYCFDRKPSICELGVKKDMCSGPDSNTAHYKPWGSWGRCTEPCGGGEQTRYRECQGPKELCEHRINSDKRDCNTDACRFPKKSIDGVTYYETDDGMCLSDFSKEECEKIAKGLKARHPKIVNKDTWFFPHGCYHSIKHNFVFYNEKPSTKRCDEERRCICRIALGKGQLIDWIYGDESVNPGKNGAPRHTPHLEPDYRAEMVEEKYVSDAVKKNQFTPGENLYELMDEM